MLFGCALSPFQSSTRTSAHATTNTPHPTHQKKAEAEAALAKLDASLSEFSAIIEAKDKQLVPVKQRECLTYVGQVEEAMVKGFPFEVPAQYASRPLLKVIVVFFFSRCVV